MKYGDGSQTGEILPDQKMQNKQTKKKNQNQQTKPEQSTHNNSSVYFPDKKPYLCLQVINIRLKSVHRTINAKTMGKIID